MASWLERLGFPEKNKFNVHSIAGLLFGDHSTVSILFVIPEAVGAINAHNTAILTELQKLGRVDTITQTDALDYPHFAEYNIVFCGSDIGTVWVAANLAHVKEFPGSVICVDATVAAYLLIGTDGGDAAAKTVLTAIAEIKGNDLGIGIEGLPGLAVGANTISSATIYNTLDMSDADITETFFGTESVAANTDVLLGAIFKRQPDSTRGILSDASEATGSRYFYGPAYSAGDLNALGLAVIELLCHMAIQATTAAIDFEISGDIGDIEAKMFGNQASEFNNGNPLIEFLTGRNSSGTRLPVGKSIYDLLGIGYVDGGGAFNLDNIRDYLRALAQYLIDGDAGAEAGGTLASGVSLPDMITTLSLLVDDLEGRLTAVRAGYLDQLDFALQEAIAALQTDLDNPAQFMANLTTLETRLSAVRAGYLDELDFALQEAIAALTAAGPTKVEMDTGHGLLATEAKQDVIDTNIDQIEVLVAEKVMGRAQLAATTIDLNQAAASYDLFTGTDQVVILESLNIKMPTGAAGGALTSISIQTDDATPGVIISAVDGVVANLTSEADLGWTGTLYITVGTKIRLTIGGGAEGGAYVCNVTAKYRAVVDGGNLA